MRKIRTFRVINSRAQFRCASCGAKRNIAVPPYLRTKNVRCHKCKEITRCLFNRRHKPREQRSGNILLITHTGEEVVVNLHDISEDGIGLDIPPGFVISSKIKLGNMVQLKCNWNSKLIDSRYLEVKNIMGRRIGLKKSKLLFP